MADVATLAPAADPAKGPAPVGAWSQPKADAWRRRVKAALDHTTPALRQGKTNIDRYRGKYLSKTPQSDTALVPTDFYYIEQKKAQLFYRLPDVYLKPMQPGLDDAAIVFQAALNAKLGPAGVNVLPRIKEVLFDVLCPVGFGALKIGIEIVTDGTESVQIGEEPDLEALAALVSAPPPMPAPSILGLSEPAVPAMPMKPVFADRPVIITKRYFVERVSPGNLAVPAEFTGSDFDDAAWIGMRFAEDLPDDDTEGGTDSEADDRTLTPVSDAAKTSQRKQRVGYEIWYKASIFDSDVKHPDVIRTFKLYDDEKDKQVIPTPRLSPYQRYDGRTPEEVTDPRSIRKVTGMPGFCIAPLTTRYVSDAWMPESDCTMARNTADEMSRGRTQQLTFRDRSMPQWGFDASRVDKDVQAKIARNDINGGIPFNGPGADATWPIEKGRYGRENFSFNDICQNDLDRIWGLGANQQGVVNQGSKTATELQLTQAASQDRMGAEREQVLGWHVTKIVPKFASLLQLFADEQEFVELVGSDAQRLKAIPPEVAQQAQQTGQNASVLVPWNKLTIQGPYAFQAKPDSQLRMDVAQYRDQLMKMYSFLANEPTVNRQELTREVLKSFNFDFAKFTQPPPPKEAAPPGLSLSVKGEDVSPLNAQQPIILDILTHLGVPVSQEAVDAAKLLGMVIAQVQQAAAQTEHGGATAQAESLSKHQTDQTGAMQGSGEPAPFGPGGM